MPNIRKAFENADWQQVVLNGGPPCFHLDGERFCLRAERWPGHGVDHPFVPTPRIPSTEELKALQKEVARLTKLDRESHELCCRLASKIGVECGYSEELRAQMKALEADRDALRAACLNQCADNLCWLSDPEVGKALPEAEFLESCRRYRNQIAGEAGELTTKTMTIAQLEADRTRLLGSLKDAVRSLTEADIAISGVHTEVFEKFDYSVARCCRWCDAYPELLEPLQKVLDAAIQQAQIKETK